MWITNQSPDFNRPYLCTNWSESLNGDERSILVSKRTICANVTNFRSTKDVLTFWVLPWEISDRWRFSKWSKWTQNFRVWRRHVVQYKSRLWRPLSTLRCLYWRKTDFFDHFCRNLVVVVEISVISEFCWNIRFSNFRTIFLKFL